MPPRHRNKRPFLACLVPKLLGSKNTYKIATKSSKNATENIAMSSEPQVRFSVNLIELCESITAARAGGLAFSLVPKSAT